MPRLRAEDLLREKGATLSPESLRKTLLLAGASEDEADDAYCERVLATEYE